MRRAEVVASFLEASLYSSYNSGTHVLAHVQMEVNQFVATNSEFKKITIYATKQTSPYNQSDEPFMVIASSDQTAVGGAADAKDIEPIISNKTILAERDEAEDTPGADQSG